MANERLRDDDEFVFPPGLVIQWFIQFLLVHPKPPAAIPPPAPPPPDLSTLQRSVKAMQHWFSAQTGLRLHIKSEIQTVQLDETDAQIGAHGLKARERIEILLREKGFNHPQTLYAVWYYGASNNLKCGAGAWPNGVTSGENLQTPGHVAALYLKARFTDLVSGQTVNCAADHFAADDQTPAINEFKMLHEIVHTMGLVNPRAPHHHDRGHTNNDRQDLMYSGPPPWLPSIIDPGGDDYIDDLKSSVFVDPTVADPDAPPGWSVMVT
jgi:hypothetical protein